MPAKWPAGPRCGAPDAGYADCIDQWKQYWSTMWADECRMGALPIYPDVCPNGIPEARFQGLCVALPKTIVPCTAIHGIITYLVPDCELSQICDTTGQDAGGQ